jgi:thiamine biosynthesis lipoprotein
MAMRVRTLLLGLLTLSALSACGRNAPPVHQAEFAVFGTRVTVSVRSDDVVAVDAAFATLGETFQRMHSDWHPWQSGALTALNAALPATAEGDEAVALSADLITLIEASQRMETLSDGAFNAAIGRLVGLWGFHTSHYPITDPPPLPARVQALSAQRPSSLDVVLSESGARTDNAAVSFDFSGIAKGLAARQACDQLMQAGLSDALINLGGDVMACGRASTAWRVAVANPNAAERSATSSPIIEVLEIDQATAVFTSGQYQRYGEWQGQRYAHILDPRSGFPLPHVLQATVMDPDPVLADAAATALVVAGPEAWRSVAEQMGVAGVIVVDEAGQVWRWPD